MRRILVTLTMSVLGTAMIIATALPAFAEAPTYTCYDRFGEIPVKFSTKSAHELERNGGYNCVKDKKDRKSS